jgi:hypothetical protein
MNWRDETPAQTIAAAAEQHMRDDHDPASQAQADAAERRFKARTYSDECDGLPVIHLQQPPTPIIRAPRTKRIRKPAEASSQPQPAGADPARPLTGVTPPQLVKCTRCGAMVMQDDAGDMISHIAIGQTVCPARPTEWTRPHNAAEIQHARAFRATTQARAAEIADGQAERAELLKRAAASRQAKAEATAAEIPRPLTGVAPPPAEAAAASQASRRRLAVVVAAQAELSDLDRAVEQLVRQHSSGAVIEAAWGAAHRIFAPQAGRA